MKIFDFCKQDVDGWAPFPVFADTVSLVNKDGIHFLASLKVVEGKQVIHVSLAVVAAIRKVYDVEKNRTFLLEQTPGILTTFFEKRVFERVPPSDLAPETNHYFSTISDCAWN